MAAEFSRDSDLLLGNFKVSPPPQPNLPKRAREALGIFSSPMAWIQRNPIPSIVSATLFLFFCFSFYSSSLGFSSSSSSISPASFGRVAEKFLQCQKTPENSPVPFFSFSADYDPRYLFPQLWNCPDPEQPFSPDPEFHSLSREDGEAWQAIFQHSSKNHPCNPGFFIEMGALDGDWGSNSWLYEKALNWRGLLIEADPSNLVKLFNNQDRQAVVRLPIAICPPDSENNYVEFITGSRAGGAVSGDLSQMDSSFVEHFHRDGHQTIKVPCRPLSSYLKALGVYYVDYWILDVEGSELQVLKSVDWNSLAVHVLMVENNSKTPQVTKFLTDKGFLVVNVPHYCELAENGCSDNTYYVNQTYGLHVPHFQSLCTPWTNKFYQK